MAWTGLRLTKFGEAALAKAHAANPLRITRLVLGDGKLNGQLQEDLIAAISPKLSVPTPAIQDKGETAIIIAHITSSTLEAGFWYRELSLYCIDPETQQEGAYLNDFAGDQGEYIGDKNSVVPVNFYMRLQIKASPDGTIVFDPSGDPIYVLYESYDQFVRVTTDGQRRQDYAIQSLQEQLDTGFAGKAFAWGFTAADMPQWQGYDGALPEGIWDPDNNRMVVRGGTE